MMVASGGTLERPALSRVLADIEQCRTDVTMVYKIDRLSRSLMEFARLVDAPSFNPPLDPSQRRRVQASAGYPIHSWWARADPHAVQRTRAGVDSGNL
jgi:hypothetical protein